MLSFLSRGGGASGPRNRFILLATAGYLLFALLWILLSDQLLGAFADVQSIVWFSTAKGVFFVVATAAMFFFRFAAYHLLVSTPRVHCWVRWHRVFRRGFVLVG